MMKREIEKIITGVKGSDGDGVSLTRIIPSPELDMLDPFLLMDAFNSDKPQDYIGGFPAHPHRGFETVTYMLAGKMRHKDSAGNEGVIEAGGVQWMRAAKGIIHSEMPEQEEGLLSGLQLWVNLPASHKMAEPSYQEMSIDQIPEEVRSADCSLKVIAGRTQNGTQGVINNNLVDPIYWDISLSSGAVFMDEIAETHNAFIYLIEGSLMVGDSRNSMKPKQFAVLTKGKDILLEATETSRLLLIAGKPINEAVERGGPFVMNTREEIKQAFADYKAGQFA